MSTDATPSWSGYIFQGEVALCKALEKIYDLKDEDIPDAYCLKLEEDEDFSLTTNIWETFQVKAYTAHNYTKYKKAWEDMTKRFPANAERNYLYLHKENVEVDKFNVTLERARLSTNIISGVYTLDNIIGKIDQVIKKIFPNFEDSDINLKRNHCLIEIHMAIKDRHRNRITKSFSLNEIKLWILNADEAFNDEIGWIEIIKIFFKTIREYINRLDENTELELKSKLENYLDQIDKLDSESLKKIITDRLYPHIKFESKLTRVKFTEYTDIEKIKNIIIQSFQSIKIDPSFNNLSYSANDCIYQLSQIGLNLGLNPTLAVKRDLHEYCENIENKKISDVDTYITQSLNLNKSEIKVIARSILNPVDIDDESRLIIPYDNKFDFKCVATSVNEINNGAIN
jgi:hypothetical protein